MSNRWREITEEERAELYSRYLAGTPIEVLCADTGIPNAESLSRVLRLFGNKQRGGQPGQAGRPKGGSRRSQSQAEELPDYYPADLPELLKEQPMSVTELANRYNRSPNTIRIWVRNLHKGGFQVVEDKGDVVGVSSARMPGAPVEWTEPITNEQEFTFAAFADLHSGSMHAQPSSLNRFMRIAYAEYGVRNVFVVGDLTHGVKGFKGIEYSFIPPLRTYRSIHAISLAQRDLANGYIPVMDGLHYYVIGGNHDYWHIKSDGGFDAVASLCNIRPDMTFLGYDSADIPLTSDIDLRMWHPKGGQTNQISGKLEKGLHEAMRNDMERAILTRTNPRLRFLLSGHLHIESKFTQAGVVAAHVGCFEGRSDLERQIARTPVIGGAIFRVRVSDCGILSRVDYTFIPFTEVHHDWENYPYPDAYISGVFEPEEVDAVFQVKE